MDQTLLRSILNKTLSTAIRHGFSALNAIFVAKHIGVFTDGTIDNLTDVILGAIGMAIPAAYSVYKAHMAQKTIATLQKIS